MLRLIRTLGVEKRWVFGLIMGFVVLAFVGMGGTGIETSSNLYAAKVNGEVILAAEFNNRYRNQYRYLQNMMGDQFNDNMSEGIKQSVLKSMIQRRLWLGMALDLGLQVADDELKEAIVNDPNFQVNNRFDGGTYRRALSNARLTPEVYENDLRGQLLVQRAQSLISTGVALLPGDVDGLTAPEETEDPAQWLVEETDHMLALKQRQAIAEYAKFLEAKAKVEIFPLALAPVPG